LSTTDIAEGTNLYFTTARANTAIDAKLSGGTGVTYANGVISIGQAVATTSEVSFSRVTTTGNIIVGGNLTANGDVSAANFNSTSDQRIKENIEQITDALDLVLKMRGVRYTLKDSGREMIGLIAQEVEQVIPEVVGMMNDELNTKTVGYGNIVGLLIEAIRDLQEQINALKHKN